jgi:hypothetical protein
MKILSVRKSNGKLVMNILGKEADELQLGKLFDLLSK